MISSNERLAFQRIPSRIMEVISRRWYYTDLVHSTIPPSGSCLWMPAFS